MNVSEPSGNELRSAGRSATTGPRDPGDIRTLLLVLAAFVFFLYLIRPILLPFVVAGVIAYICTPLLDWLAARTRLPRPLFAALLFLILIGIALTAMTLAGQNLIAELKSTSIDLQGTLESLARRATGDRPINWFGHTIDPGEIARALPERLRDWFGEGDRIALLVGFGFAAVVGMFLSAVLLCYFLVTGKSVARGLFWIVPPSRRPLVAEIGTRLNPVLRRYFVGILAIVIYAVIAAYVGLGLILNIQHAFLLALLTGILETIPLIGSTSAAVIAGLVSLRTATGYMSILAFALYAVLLRLSIDQVVAPLVLGRAANVHPVLIIFCFLSGAVLFGIPGVILAVPTALLVKATLATIYGEDDQLP